MIGRILAHVAGVLALAAALGGTGAAAQDARVPVVVELFTSQGCSSCPPADALLRELAQQEGVIPLALHVDYWDYIGWADSFARPEHTLRQKAYARAHGGRMIYTPQMVVGGTDGIAGTKPGLVRAALERHAARDDLLPVTLAHSGGRLRVTAPAAQAPAEMAVQLVRYLPEQRVKILRGENAGRVFDYVNIVTDWDVIARWDGRAPLALEVAIEGDAPAVVILQEADHGAVRGAARLR
jgi:hypothetical protein